MSTVEERIQASAARNKELLAILTESNYAASALEKQKQYITDLQQEISRLATAIKKLELNRQKELNDYDRYRHSHVTRLAYKVTLKGDKFKAKASKEENEYLEAVQEEQQAKKACEATMVTLSEAKKQQSELEATASVHSNAQRELDTLYATVFDVPAAGYPEENATANAAKAALSTYQTARTEVESDTEVVHILTNALYKMQAAMAAMDQGRQSSRMDVLGGGNVTDMMERSALTRADQLCMETQMLIMQAQRLSPYVKDISKPNIAQGNIMRDVMFDNLVTDISFHDKIKQSQIEVRTSARAVEQEGAEAKKRLNETKLRLEKDKKRWEDSRYALQKAREAAFERGVGVPPAYTAR